MDEIPVLEHFLTEEDVTILIFRYPGINRYEVLSFVNDTNENDMDENDIGDLEMC